MKTNYSFLFLPLILSLLVSCNGHKTWELDSPNGQISVTIMQNPQSNNQITYQVDFIDSNEGKSVIAPSLLGIERNDAVFSNNLKFVDSQRRFDVEHQYQMKKGKQLINHAFSNELVLSFINKNNQPLNIVFQAFNDGIGFKYQFPGKSKQIFSISRELSEFAIPKGGHAWIQPYDTLAQWSPAYEYGYERKMTVGTKPPLSTGWGFPALFENDGIWALVSETGLDESYCGSHLSANCEDGVYRIEYPFEWENYGLWDALPKSNLPWETPWRIIIIGNHPGRIAESNLPFHLADPCKLEDTTWIRPGASSWNWWSDHGGGWKFESLKDYIDLSDQMGWKYSLVDAEWHRMQGGTLEELANYAKEKEIGLHIWYNSGGEHSRVMDAGPRDLMDKSEIRQKEMQRIADMGIKGIKVDFFQGDKQNTIQLYLDIIKNAAAHNLLVNTHGCTIPRGWDRTWPNLLSMEAVRGGELYSYPPYPERAVWQNTILPFTRNVIGSMDFTPVTFSDYSPETKHITTNAHELALSVIFESGIQHFADRAESYRSQPEYVIDFLKNVPVTWDDTHITDGYPGEFVVMCREKADRFYIAGINGTIKSKNISFKIPNLKDDQEYILKLISDGSDSRSFTFSTLKTTKEKTHTIEMLPAGGFCGIISKTDK